MISVNEINITGADPCPCEWYTGTFSIQSKANPKQFDFVIKDGEFTIYKGRTALAIYEVEGNTLTWAANEPGLTVRPTAFTPGYQDNGDHYTRVYILEKQNSTF